MRKYVYYTIFLLSFALMFIMGSCKSSHSVETKTDSVSVQSVRMEDSLHLDRTFQFDRMEIYLSPTLPQGEGVRQAVLSSLGVDSIRKLPVCSPSPSGRDGEGFYVCITKGSASSAITKTEKQTQADSTAVKHQDVIHPVITPPKLPSWLIVLIFCFITYIAIISRNRT